MEKLKSIIGILLVVSIALFPTGCKDEVDPGTPPSLPPLESMVMDFSGFDDGNSGGRLETQQNWGTAVVHVAVWNAILSINLALPVASFANAINETPSYDFDRERWVWTYDYQLLGRTYTSELTAVVTSSVIIWEMNISEENGFQDVTWYTGETNVNGNSGYWLLNYNANDPAPKLRVDWVKTGENIGLITYTNVIEGDANQGGFIEYGRKVGTGYDAYYEISLPSRSSDVNIDWNSSTGAGRIMDPVTFEDEEWHCWDENFDDADC